jgi:hypothetical protein
VEQSRTIAKLNMVPPIVSTQLIPVAEIRKKLAARFAYRELRSIDKPWLALIEHAMRCHRRQPYLVGTPFWEHVDD